MTRTLVVRLKDKYTRVQFRLNLKHYGSNNDTWPSESGKECLTGDKSQSKR